MEATLRKLEVSVGAAVCALAVFLHGVLLGSAGALWRDEANSVAIAALPTFADVWRTLQFDSFPAGWFVVLRAWIAAGPGRSDGGLRVLGFLVGLGILAALWVNARRLGAPAPLLGLAAFGLNVAVIVYGDSVRGYGIGMLLGLVAFGAIEALARQPSRARFVVAAAASALSVHFLFYDAVLVLAACTGGCALSLVRRRPREAGIVVAAGIPAAVSLLVYARTIENTKAWNEIVRYDIGLSWIALRFREALSESGEAYPWIWLAIVLGAVLVGGAALLRARSRGWTREHETAVFCLGTLVAGAVSYLVFLARLRYIMQPWYFLVFLALVGATLDGVLAVVRRSAPARLAKAGAVALVVLAVAAPAWNATRTRKTSLDLVAAQLETLAGSGDVVVLSPWYYGVAFDRYSRGPAGWTTLPPMEQPRVHTGTIG